MTNVVAFDPVPFHDKMLRFRGEQDTLWNRGEEGSPVFHHGWLMHAASIEYEMGQMLMSLVKDRKPNTIVEIGTNIGYSTSCLLLAALENGKGTVTTFDIEDVQVTYKDMIAWKVLGLPTDNLKVVTEPTWATDKLPTAIDFVFHDASHDVEPTKLEVERLAPLITKEGVMAFHDIFLCRHMGEFLFNWFKDRGSEWKYSEIRRGRGLGVAIRL